MTDRELMQQSLDALDYEAECGNDDAYHPLRDALRSRLAQPEQEPVAIRLWDSQWVNVVNHDNCYQDWNKEDAINHAVKMTEKYIAENVANGTSPPPQRKPLTHEQRVNLLAKFEAHKHKWHAPAILIDMVEAAHGIKENT